MTPRRLLATLGASAAAARRMGLRRPMNALIDAIDACLLRAEAPLLKTSFDEGELRGYLRHRGFLEYVEDGMPEESYYQSLVVAAVNSETTFVDAGAHIGVYTVLTCRHARRVLAFEPDPYNLAALRRNVERAACGNVAIRPEAVADRAGDADFRAFRSTFSGSLAPRRVDAYRTVAVETISLDAVLTESDHRNLVVKLDIEGGEPWALRGMSAAISRARRLAIFAEVNAEALEAGGSSARQLVQDLLATGLECSWIDEDRRTLVPVQSVPDANRLNKGNVMCVRRSTG